MYSTNPRRKKKNRVAITVMKIYSMWKSSGNRRLKKKTILTTLKRGRENKGKKQTMGSKDLKLMSLIRTQNLSTTTPTRILSKKMQN
jgi:hypothetical protein